MWCCVAVPGRDLGHLQCRLPAVCAGVTTETPPSALPHFSALHIFLVSLHRCIGRQDRNSKRYWGVKFCHSARICVTLNWLGLATLAQGECGITVNKYNGLGHGLGVFYWCQSSFLGNCYVWTFIWLCLLFVNCYLVYYLHKLVIVAYVAVCLMQ